MSAAFPVLPFSTARCGKAPKAPPRECEVSRRWARLVASHTGFASAKVVALSLMQQTSKHQQGNTVL